MGTWNTWPNYNELINNFWGAGQAFESSGPCSWFAGASNLVFGANPPYYLDTFLAFFPKFFGLPTVVPNCGTASGSQAVTVPSVYGFMYGQLVQNSNLPPGTVVTGLGNGTITVSNPATASSSNTPLVAYQQPPIPTAVILMYLMLANSSLVQARWQEQWMVAMGWFIAHYATLYAKSDASEVMELLQAATHGEVPQGTAGQAIYALSTVPPGGVLQSLTNNGVFLVPGTDYVLSGQTITLLNPQLGDALWATWQVQVQQFTSIQPNGAQIAAQGLAGGIQTAKSVGDVSVSYQSLASLEDWGAWNLTAYGQQLATMAKVVGAGPMLIY